MKISILSLERLTTSLAITLLTVMVFVLSLTAANYIFGWDLFPPELEKAGVVFVISSVLIIFSSVVVNIMINVGRIADKFNEE
jgi:hypothetical protein